MNELTIVQSVIIVKDDKVLMGKRSLTEDVFPGLWGIPGGKVDITDKSLEDGLRREVMEEAGIEITNIHMVQSNINEQKKKAYITYTAEWLSGEPRSDENEIDEYAFMDKKQIEALEAEGMVTPFTFEIIKSVL